MKILKYQIYFSILLIYGLTALSCSENEDTNLSSEQPETMLTVTGYETTIAKEGESRNLKLVTNRGWYIEHNSGEWLQLVSDHLGDPGEYELEFKAAANNNAKSRSAIFTVLSAEKSQQIELTQFGSDPEIIVTTKKINADCDAKSYNIVVNSNVAITPTYSENWFTIEDSPYKMASNVFVVNVESNYGSQRDGEIVFSDEDDKLSDEVLITQNAYESRFTIKNNRLNVSALSQEASALFVVNRDWTLEWPESGKPSWIDRVSVISGKANVETLVKFDIQPNTGKARSVVLNLKFGSVTEPITISQAEPIISDTGTRETDSIALAKFYKSLEPQQCKWDFSQPISSWGPWVDGNDETRYCVILNPQGRVIELYLPNFNISGVLPESIAELPTLRKLTFYRLRANNLSFPESLNKLTDLQEMEISFGIQGGTLTLPNFDSKVALHSFVISGLDQNFAPTAEYPVINNLEGIKSLHNLEKIWFEHVKIGNLPDLRNCSKLRTLTVNNTDITRFPAEIGEFTDLRQVIMMRNSLEGELDDIFSKTKLTTFDITNNEMSGELPIAMFKSETLLAVYLSGNNFTGDLSEEIVTSRISQFSCRDNRLGGLGVMLSDKILSDKRWSIGWYGTDNICPQQEEFGWMNCN